jgi:membrane peptidoglycan carboxypeptidase
MRQQIEHGHWLNATRMAPAWRWLRRCQGFMLKAATVIMTGRARLAQSAKAEEAPVRSKRTPVRTHWIWLIAGWTLRCLVWAAIIASLGFGVAYDARTSYLQSRLFAWFDNGIWYRVGSGANPRIQFPRHGPRNMQLGYAELSTIIPSLEAHQFQIVRQTQWSPRLDWFVSHGGYMPYHGKLQTGLRVLDRTGVPLVEAHYPLQVYQQFSEVPKAVVKTLAFVEDRALLDDEDPLHDPAIEWKRFAVAAFGQVAGLFDHRWQRGGASTLATQIVKFDDSPDGRTESVTEKLRQMLTAAVAAYRSGPDTVAARQDILLTYLDSTPLAARPGFGAIIGIPEGLAVWYGTDVEEADRLLTQPALAGQAQARQGEVYRQILSLILAGQRPSYYLVQNHAALEALINAYLPSLAKAGVISVQLRDAAMASRLQFRLDVPSPRVSFAGNKAADFVQSELLSLLHLDNATSLDHYDLATSSSIDDAEQQRVAGVLTRLDDRAYDRSLGLVGKQMLGDGNPALVTWSFVLYERGHDANHVRIHVDSLNEPFDINSGAKLQLGSTAKLRTLITYLDIMVDLHRELAPQPTPMLQHIAATAPDALTRWAASYLLRSRNPALSPMLKAAMERTYSAAPVTFFTGGGNNSFGNFEPWENSLVPTVQFAFENSINCAFVRLMGDIRNYFVGQIVPDEGHLLSDPHDPARMTYLQQFVHQEGLTYLHKFYIADQDLTPSQVVDKLARQTTPLASHLADLFLTVYPDAHVAALTEFLRIHMPAAKYAELDSDRLGELYDEFAAKRLSLNAAASVAHVHPLALWLACYLQTHPNADWNNVVEASSPELQQSYAWLFRPGSTFEQNRRIRMLLEQQAFRLIWQDWQRVGYPFDRLVPSLGTAIGASGDRPDALATLIGIVINDGIRQPTVDIDRLNFADGTPYQTDFLPQPVPQRVLNPLVAQTVKQALLGVVRSGTGAAVRGGYHAANGDPLAIGGKTGTGDNRYHIYGRGGYLRGERVVDRTATFAFFLGDRFFGTVTAYVQGPRAIAFNFSSTLAVQLLRALRPQLEPLLQAGPAAQRSQFSASQAPQAW